jgi:hypothetical protein
MVEVIVSVSVNVRVVEKVSVTCGKVCEGMSEIVPPTSTPNRLQYCR